MTTVEEVQLPGVGVRHEFVTKGGERVAVIAYRTGRKELILYDKRDPDSCREVLRLDDEDSRTLAELLGGSHTTEGEKAGRMGGEGFAIDWTKVPVAAACAGMSLADAVRPAGSGASVAAIVRGSETIPTPPPDFRLQAGDTAVLIGTADGIHRLNDALQRG